MADWTRDRVRELLAPVPEEKPWTSKLKNLAPIELRRLAAFESMARAFVEVLKERDGMRLAVETAIAAGRNASRLYEKVMAENELLIDTLRQLIDNNKLCEGHGEDTTGVLLKCVSTKDTETLVNLARAIDQKRQIS